jgi:hypothetical protein
LIKDQKSLLKGGIGFSSALVAQAKLDFFQVEILLHARATWQAIRRDQHQMEILASNLRVIVYAANG